MQLSVIIPTLNEEEFIKPCLESLSLIDPDEVIVVDGGSMDKTVEIAKSFGAKVIVSQRGRGKQLSLGAKLAQGDYLLFLHADCQFTKPIELRADTVFWPGCSLAGSAPNLVFKVRNSLSELLNQRVGIVLDCCFDPCFQLGGVEDVAKAFKDIKERL